jgi:hypothetical protein
VSTEEEERRADAARLEHLRTVRAILSGSTETPQISPEEETRKLQEGERSHRRNLALIRNIEQTTKLQRRYARRAYTFLKWWTISVGALLVLDALQAPPVCETEGWSGAVCDLFPRLDISDNVLIAIVGSTAVAVIGLVLAVIKGLFPVGHPPQESS